MQKIGIEVGTHYRPVDLTSMYQSKLKLKNTEQAGEKIDTLPIHRNLSNKDVDFIIKNINKFLEKNFHE